MAEEVSDTYAERLRTVEFLYAKNDQYNTVDLHFFDKKHDKIHRAVDLLSFDCSKLRLDNELKIYYIDKPCNVSTENVAASIIKGHHLILKLFLQLVSIGLSDPVWKIFITIMIFTYEKTKKLSFFVNSVLFNIIVMENYL